MAVTAIYINVYLIANILMIIFKTCESLEVIDILLKSASKYDLRKNAYKCLQCCTDLYY